jgi:hypothetical protein
MREQQQEVFLVNLIRALEQNNSWCGETHIQKCAFFLQEGLGVPLNLEFVLYKHGPFSFDLRDLLGGMRAKLLIDVRPQPVPYGPSLSPGASAEGLRARYPKITRTYARHIDFVAKQLGRNDVVALERIGTALYVRREHPDLSPDDLGRVVTQLKPHIRGADAVAAAQEVDRLLTDAASLGLTEAPTV